MQNLAPIIIVVYNRPQHTRKMLEALENATLASQSNIYIFSDGAKDAANINLVNQVRAILREPRNFNNINITERSKNIGLANNIITGIQSVLQAHGKAIILEDDLIISKHGLEYFNDALTAYQPDEKVMAISGYMYPIKDKSALDEGFFFRVPNTWGWATWDRAWKHFETDITKSTKDFSKDDIRRFSIDYSEDFWKQVKQIKAGKINSWAIHWYLSVFNQNGLVLYPRESMIQNIGTEGSSTHSDEDIIYDSELASKPISTFPNKIEEHKVAYNKIQFFYKHRKGTLFSRILRYIKKFKIIS